MKLREGFMLSCLIQRFTTQKLSKIRGEKQIEMTIRVLEHLQKISVQVGVKLKSVLFECWQLAGHYSINFRLRILKKATIRQKSLTLR